MCNIWQGDFPRENTGKDGFAFTCPTDAFLANGYALYSMCGNTWEWCADWFSSDYHLTATRESPTGPLSGEAKVIRGGSFLCHKSYCNRYRVAARTSNTPDSSTSNMSFRCASDKLTSWVSATLCTVAHRRMGEAVQHALVEGTSLGLCYAAPQRAEPLVCTSLRLGQEIGLMLAEDNCAHALRSEPLAKATRVAEQSLGRSCSV